jgi:hypothetical protein
MDAGACACALLDNDTMLVVVLTMVVLRWYAKCLVCGVNVRVTVVAMRWGHGRGGHE